jgi:hypothetical protein
VMEFYHRHCERSEAIQTFLVALDCFASLAMTGNGVTR